MGLHLYRLKASENLIVLSMRSWVAAVKNNQDPRPRVEDSFAAARMPAAAGTFDELMLLAVERDFRGTDIPCMSSKVVGSGEVDILAVLAFLQAEKIHWAYNRLLTWLPAAAARKGFVKSRALANHMNLANLNIEVRDEYLEFEVAYGLQNLMPSPGLSIQKTIQ